MGKLPNFDQDVEPWDQYSQRLEAHFVVNKTLDTEKKAVLLTVLPPPTLTLLNSLIYPKKVLDTDYAVLTALFDTHFNPKPSRILERLKFNRRYRQNGESVAEYVAELKRLSVHCGFGKHLDEMIMHQFVCGINNDEMQQRLTEEDDDIKLQVAINLTQKIETAKHNSQQMKSHTQQDSASKVHAIQYCAKNVPKQFPRNRQAQDSHSHQAQDSRSHQAQDSRSYQGHKNQYTECSRCKRRDHPNSKCPFIKSTCHSCGKKGHITPACKNISNTSEKKDDNQTSGRKHTRRNNRTNHIQEEEGFSSINEYPVHQITMGKNKVHMNEDDAPPPETITCRLNGKEFAMEIDSGSGHTIISEETFHRIPGKSSIEQFSKTLRSVTGEHLKVLGKARIHVQYDNKEETLPLLIIRDINQETLCGRKWLYSSLAIVPSVLSQTERVHKINVPSNLTLDYILNKYEELFSPGLGQLRNVEVQLAIKKEHQPKFCKARSIPYAKKEIVERELRRMEMLGIIESVDHSQYASPIVTVMKPQKPGQPQKVRICGDFKTTANPAIDTAQYPLPKAEDIFATLAGCKYFARIDLRDAYNQIALHQDSKAITVINTPLGLYRYNRLPFGIASASALFQRHIETLFRNKHGVSPFQDDILLGGRTANELLQLIDEVLNILLENGLKLKKEKCCFLQKSVEFLGHVLDEAGIHPQAEKMTAIMKAPEPENLEQLRSFVGLLMYYAKFIPNTSTKLAPLYELFEKASKWSWEERHKKAFNDAKQAIKASNILTHYDLHKDVYLACDASPRGIGAVISHIENGEEKPISFASRTLTKAERNYSQLDKEALAIIFGVLKFKDYVYGRKFYLYTDHQPLIYLFASDKPIPAMAAARLQRWAIILSAYQYEIRHKKGKNNANADALSRLPLPINDDSETPIPAEYVFLIRSLDESTVSNKALAEATQSDPTLQQVRKYMREGWPNRNKLSDELETYHRRQTELSNIDNIMVLGNRVIIPPQHRQSFISELHSSHQGIVAMKALARSKIWWPGIDKDLEHKARTCKSCQEHATMPAAKYKEWPKAEGPWKRVHCDFAGPIENKFLLITVDSFTKWIEVDITNSTSTATVTQCLRRHISRFGIMPTLVTDNGPCFSSKEFNEFNEVNGIQHLTSAPYHPASNGLAERGVRTIKSNLKKMNGSYDDATVILGEGLLTFHKGSLEERISRILLNYRRTPNATGRSPSEAMLGRTILTRLDTCNPRLFKSTKDISKEGDMGNEKSNIYHSYRVNDEVSVLNFGNGPKWINGTITKLQGNMMFEIVTYKGKCKRHKNQIRIRPIAQSNPEHWQRKSTLPSTTKFPASTAKQADANLIEKESNASQTTSQPLTTATAVSQPNILQPEIPEQVEGRSVLIDRTDPTHLDLIAAAKQSENSQQVPDKQTEHIYPDRVNPPSPEIIQPRNDGQKSDRPRRITKIPAKLKDFVTNM